MYWENRYAASTRSAAGEKERKYEWFETGFDVLAPLLFRFLSPTDSVVEIGCGTSDLLAGLLAAGHAGKLCGTDFSASAVAHMQARHGTADGRLRFEEMDARDMSRFADGSVDVVLDKGCLNGIVASGEHGESSTIQACAEVGRVLRDGGWFLSFSCHDPRDEDEGCNGMNVLEEMLLPGLKRGATGAGEEGRHAWRIEIHSSEDPTFKIHLYAFQKRRRPLTRAAVRGEVSTTSVTMHLH
jgi:SAM-dependent methyltransferase